MTCFRRTKQHSLHTHCCSHPMFVITDCSNNPPSPPRHFVGTAGPDPQSIGAVAPNNTEVGKDFVMPSQTPSEIRSRLPKSEQASFFSPKHYTPVLPRKKSDLITERKTYESPCSYTVLLCMYAELTECLFLCPGLLNPEPRNKASNAPESPDHIGANLPIARIVQRTNQTSRSQTRALCLGPPPGRTHPAPSAWHTRPARRGRKRGTAESDKQPSPGNLGRPHGTLAG